MGTETEIKLRIDDTETLRRTLRRLGATISVPRTLEENVVFDTEGSDLKSREQLLRIRCETRAARGRKARRRRHERVLLTFKRPVESSGKSGAPERHKTREELELQASDGSALGKIFEGLGLRPWFRYEKFRTTYRLPERWAKQLLVELDETPMGTFVELEGPARAIDRAARALGFAAGNYIVANYMELYREYCQERGEIATQMVFADGKARWEGKKAKKVL